MTKAAAGDGLAGTNLPQADLQHLLALYSAQRFAEMAQRVQALLSLHPNVGELWKALSVAQPMQGQDALPALQRAFVLLPHDAAKSCCACGRRFCVSRRPRST